MTDGFQFQTTNAKLKKKKNLYQREGVPRAKRVTRSPRPFYKVGRATTSPRAADVARRRFERNSE